MWNTYHQEEFLRKKDGYYTAGWRVSGETWDNGGQMDIFDDSISVTEKEFEEYYFTIDTAQLCAEVGVKEQQVECKGKVTKRLEWNPEKDLLKAIQAVEYLSSEGKPVRITGAAPAWLVAALTHAVHPCPVSVYVPQVGKYVDIPALDRGEANPEGEVKFEVIEKGDIVWIEYTMDFPEGISAYDEANLPKVVT